MVNARKLNNQIDSCKFSTTKLSSCPINYATQAHTFCISKVGAIRSWEAVSSQSTLQREIA